LLAWLQPLSFGFGCPKLMILVVCGWATPRFFDLYEYFIWSLSDQNRMPLEALTYLGFFCAIILTVSGSLDRARAEGRNAEIASRQNKPLQKSN
jgi:hypothetical protein